MKKRDVGFWSMVALAILATYIAVYYVYVRA